MSGNGRIFAASVNHPQACVVEILHLGGAVMVKHVKIPGVSCTGPSINDDGKVIVIKTVTSTTEDIVIIDGHEGKVVQTVQNMVGGGFVCMSDKGHLIATGFYDINVLHWDANNRTLDVVDNIKAPQNYMLNLCEWHKGLAGGKPLLALQYASASFAMTQLSLVSVDWQTGSAKPVWTFDAPHANNTNYQNVVQTLAFDQHARVVLMTAWGADQKNVPTVMLVDVNTGALAWSLSTPGSMNSGDVAHISGNTFRVVCAGKHVHANIFGDGGDAYAYDITL